MRYIKDIVLRNFQSHTNSNITIGEPGQVTGIVGPTGNGKTAILRALKWVSHNTPSGDDFIKVGEKECRVAVIMSNEVIVERLRSKGGVNRYNIIKAGDVQKYESFGTGVPAEVQAALEISPLTIGDQTFTLNFSGQLDGPFLGNDLPSSARAKVLGKLSGVEEVDYANRLLGIDLYRLKRDAEVWEAQTIALAAQLKNYEYLESLEEIIETVQKSLDDAEDTDFKLSRLQRIQNEQNDGRLRLSKDKDRINSLNWSSNITKVMDAMQDLEQGKTLQRILDQMIMLLNALEGNQSKVAVSNNALSLTNQLPVAEGMLHKIEQMQEITKQLQCLSAFKSRLQDQAGRLSKIDAQGIDEAASLADRLRQYSQLSVGIQTETENRNEYKRLVTALSMELESPISEGQALLNKIDEMWELVNDLEFYLNRKEDMSSLVKNAKAKEDIAANQYKTFTDEYHVCPLCHQEVKEWRI